MAVFRTVIRSDLQKPLVVQQLSGNMFTADNASNEIAVEVTNGGEPVALSGAVTAYAVRADGVTAMFSGTISGNVASVVLPASCYVEVGTLSIVIKVGTTTVGACTCYVYRTTTDEIVDPGHVIPSIDELLEQIDACRTATTNANTATANANTAASNANTKATLADEKATLADQKATLANTAAQNADTKASLADTAAGKINNMTVAATGLPAGSAPVATITEVDGHKHIAFQIPKGDNGKDFHIAKTFSSISAMMAYTGTDLEKYDFAMIDTGSVEDPDTGKLYCYEPDKNPKWSYIGDLSGAQGIKGETGTGIDHVSLNADYTLTVYYDDGTSDTTTSIRGATGITPNIAIGTVTTLLPDQQAYVTRDPSSTAENPVFNFGIPKGDTGAVDNVYGTTVPMSESDSTSVYNAIGSKLNKNQGTANSGKFMKVGADGELTPENVPDPTNKADKVTNATAGNFAGLDATGNLTDSGKSTEDFAGAIYKTIDTPASIVTIEDGADDLPVKELKVAIDPVQDLHGYDFPWPAGGGVNKFACGDAIGVILSAAYGLTVVCDGETETITISGTPTWTSVGLKRFRIISTKSGSYYGDAPVTHDYSGMNGEYFVVSKSQNITNITTRPTLNSEGTIGIVLTCTDTEAVSIVLKLCIYEGDTAPTSWTPYSNICPITGWTGAKVTRTGKNLLNISPITLSAAGDWANNKELDKPIPAGTYTFAVTTSAQSAWTVNFKDENGDRVGQGSSSSNIQGRQSVTVTLTGTATKIGGYLNAPATMSDFQLEVGSTATAYEPYQGETYDITFPSEAGTVYGGTLNPVTGELVVDKAEVDLGNMTWSVYQASNGSFTTPFGAMANNSTDALSSQYLAVKNYSEWTSRDRVFYKDTNGKLHLKDSTYANYSVSDFKTAMSGVQIVYPLATPITYQLTAQEIRTLLGVNNIWADTGDITKLIYSVNTDTAMALYEKADKVANATVGNFAALDAEGNLKDSGKKPGDFLTEHQDISGKLDKDQGSANAGKFMKVGNDGNLVPDNVPDPSSKADKVQNPTAGNFAGLDANGNLTDSGKKPSDFLTQHQDISGKVDKNQGTENAGKALGINSQGQVVPVPFSGEDFTGATSTSAGTHGYVPAPQITDMTKFLCGDGTWADVAGGKLVTFELDEVTGTGGSYGHITYISSVTHDMKAVLIEVSDPDVFLDEITISCMDGGIALSCDDVNGTSTVTVSCLFKANPDNITSSEFDVLANRIGTLGNLKTTAKSNLVGAVNELYDDIAETQDGLGIVADGDTHAAVSSGQFVYVKNHETLSDGLYKATAAISANGALSTSNLTPDGSGGLNALKGDIDTLSSNLSNKIKKKIVTVTPVESQYAIPFTHTGNIPWDNDININNFISAHTRLTAAMTFSAFNGGIQFFCNNSQTQTVVVCYIGS